MKEPDFLYCNQSFQDLCDLYDGCWQGKVKKGSLLFVLPTGTQRINKYVS